MLYLNEIVHELRKKKTPAVILKLYFEKACDMVSWSFLRQVLTSKGFASVFMHPIMQLVEGSQMVITVNGESVNFLEIKEGCVRAILSLPCFSTLCLTHFQQC